MKMNKFKNKTKARNQIPRHSSFSAGDYLRFGIISGPVWSSFGSGDHFQFGDNFQSEDHLRSGIICGAVQNCTNKAAKCFQFQFHFLQIIICRFMIVLITKFDIF